MRENGGARNQWSMTAARRIPLKRTIILGFIALPLVFAQNSSLKAQGDNVSPAVERNNEAVRLCSEGRDTEAEVAYRAALELAGDDLVRAKIATNLGTLYQRQDRYPEAEAMFHTALELRRKNLAASDVDLAYAQNNLAEIYRVEGRDLDALGLMERAAKNLRTFHPDAPGLPIILTNLAIVLCRFNESDKAEELVRSAVSMHEARHEIDSRDYGVSLNNLGQVLELKRRFGAAALYFEQSIAVFDRMGEGRRTDLAATLANAGELYQRMNRMEDAARVEQRALDLLRPGADVLLRAQILQNLGNVQANSGHAATALPYFAESLSIHEMTVGAEHPSTASLLLDYAAAMLRAGNKAVAKKLRKRAEDVLARIGSHSPSQLTVALRDLHE